MGAAIGAALRANGETVLWASSGRSSKTAERAARAGLGDVGDVAELCRRCEVLISVCPPHAALEVARSATGFTGTYVDANAISPQTAKKIGEHFGCFVDGGIIGPPPRERGTSRLYLSGREAGRITALFAGTVVDALSVSDAPGAASALKMAYAGWTKGSAALLLATRALARAEGVEEKLLDEWELSQPHLAAQSARASRSALDKGWRWVGEMNEIADSYAANGLPPGFHRAAAEIYGRVAGSLGGEDVLPQILTAIRKPRSEAT